MGQHPSQLLAQHFKSRNSKTTSNQNHPSYPFNT